MKNQRVIIPKQMVNKKRVMRIKNWLKYLMTCSGLRNKKPLLTMLSWAKKLETRPKNGCVSKRTKKPKTSTVTVRGRRRTRPVIKCFFMFYQFYSVKLCFASGFEWTCSKRFLGCKVFLSRLSFFKYLYHNRGLHELETSFPIGNHYFFPLLFDWAKGQ